MIMNNSSTELMTRDTSREYSVHSPLEKKIMLVNWNHTRDKLPVCSSIALTREESMSQAV